MKRKSEEAEKQTGHRHPEEESDTTHHEESDSDGEGP